MPASPVRVGLFGGSFNPVHLGHVRLAIEVREALGLSRVELVPTYHHPLKSGEGFLPFHIRYHLVALAVCGVPGLLVNDLEAALPGPSYTVNTLEAFASQHPGERAVFILGAEDLLKLPEWYEGRRLPVLADLAVVPRGPASLVEARGFIQDFWPDARPTDAPELESKHGDAMDWQVGFAGEPGRILLVDIPRLEISATDIRERFRTGRSIHGFVPERVEQALARMAGEVRQAWSVEERPSRNCCSGRRHHHHHQHPASSDKS